MYTIIQSGELKDMNVNNLRAKMETIQMVGMFMWCVAGISIGKMLTTIYHSKKG